MTRITAYFVPGPERRLSDVVVLAAAALAFGGAIAILPHRAVTTKSVKAKIRGPRQCVLCTSNGGVCTSERSFTSARQRISHEEAWFAPDASSYQGARGTRRWQAKIGRLWNCRLLFDVLVGPTGSLQSAMARAFNRV